MTDDLTAEEIVEGLRSDLFEERQAALGALFPGEPSGAMLVRHQALRSQASWTETSDASRMFVSLLHLAQQFGTHLGLTLAWVQDPAQQDKQLIQVPRM